MAEITRGESLGEPNWPMPDLSVKVRGGGEVLPEEEEEEEAVVVLMAVV